MRLIPPLQVEDEGAPGAMAELITASSTIPEPDPDNAEEASATLYDAGDAPYDEGDRVIQDHMLYESAVGSNNTAPNIGVAEVPAKWVLIGPSNQWKALTLTTAVEDRSTYDDEIVYTFDVNTPIDSLAVHNISANSVQVQFYDPDDNLVYDETISTASLAGIEDAYDWCFKPTVRINQIAGFEIPAYSSGRIVVTITDTGELAGVGKIIFGYSEYMGQTLSPVRTDLIDLSRTYRNTYGNTILVPGRQIFGTSIDTMVNSDRAGELKKIIKGLTGKPATVIGEPDVELTVIYGRVIDYNIVLNSYPLSQATLKTEDF